MAWVERTTMIIKFQPPCYVLGHQTPDQAAQSHIQPGLECLQGWGIHNLLGQPAPVRHHPLGEKIPSNIQPKPPLSQLKPFHLVLSLSTLVNSCSPSCLCAPFKYWKDTMRSSQSLLQAKQSQFPQPFPTGEVLQPSDHLSGPPLDPLQELHVLPVLGAQAWMQYSRRGLTRAEQRGTITSLSLLATPFLMQPRT